MDLVFIHFNVIPFILSLNQNYHIGASFKNSVPIFCSQIGLPGIDARTLKFLVSVTSNYKSTVDKVIKDHCLRLFGEILGIISYLECMYKSNDIEQAIMEIENIFITEPPAILYKCKPNLAHFLAGLFHMEVSESEDLVKNKKESDDDGKCCAGLGLYHLLLKERHWAFVHLALTAFRYFAANTKRNNLWDFVPEDAALSYDVVSEVETSTGRFVAEFGTFLSKKMTLLTVAPSPEQLELLGREGLVLKQMVPKISVITEQREGCESMEVDDQNHSNRKRKLPDGISKGVELLKSGLKIISDGLSEWQLNQLDADELHIKYTTQFSRLEDVITHFEELAGSSEVCLSYIQS